MKLALEGLIEFPKLKKITHFETAFGLMETGNVGGKKDFKVSSLVGLTVWLQGWHCSPIFREQEVKLPSHCLRKQEL